MKKFLSLFVALAMVLSLFAGVGAHTAKAAGAATVTVGSATILVAGGSAVIDVTATIPAGQNIDTMGFTLTYDGSKISIPVVGVTAGALPGVFSKNNPNANSVIVGGLAPDVALGVPGPSVVLAHVTIQALAGLTAGTSTPITLSAVALADSAVVSYAPVTLVAGTVTGPPIPPTTNAATVTVGSATILVAGGSAVVDVTAVIPAGQNIASMGFTLTYDGTRISLPVVGVTAGALPGVFSKNNPDANTLIVGGLAPDVTVGVAGPTVVLAHIHVNALAGFTGTTPSPLARSRLQTMQWSLIHQLLSLMASRLYRWLCRLQLLLP